jgi:competence protein ComEC
MKREYLLFVVGFLFLLNFFCWKEVFALAGNNNLKVNFLDVGQGDSAFIKTPGMHKILIDGGPGSSALREISFLMPFWDRKIDLVILTHPESDHMQGILYLLQRYKADYILWSGVKKTAPEYNEWIDVLEYQKKNGAKILIAKAGQEIKAGDVLIDTLFPFESLEGFDVGTSANDTCVVSRVVYGGNSFLFTGDIDFKAEEELVGSGEDIASDVLKVAHHGSKYSTSDVFLQAVMPKIAVIEVGADNTYGHPTSEVLQKLENSGIKIFRTDQFGTVKMESDGRNIKIIN